ncbi:MAG: hypothetical protein K0R47_5714, partial [Brevibacillus sp.]|nr:hypothetical protein [Brevibacillus sp.]
IFFLFVLLSKETNLFVKEAGTFWHLGKQKGIGRLAAKVV